MKDLIKAIEQEAETPCKRFSCTKFQECADERLACSAFACYVQTGRTVHPFNFVTPRSAEGKQRMQFVGEVHPTRSLFDDIQNDTWAADGGGGWDDKRAAKAREESDALLVEIGGRNLSNWFALSKERAETTLRRHQEAECQNSTSTSTPSVLPTNPSTSA